MNYSAVGIANVALLRIGARGTISSFQDDSPNAIKVNTVWNSVFQEVLSERDWKFAKTKVELQQSTIKPVFGYCFAYSLPADFLRLVKPKEIPQERQIAQAEDYGYGWGNGWGRIRQSDVPVWPRHVHPYIVETVANTSVDPPTYSTCLLTNYNGCVVPVGITYIRLITDLTQLLPGFVNCLTYRLAAELAVSVTEDVKKQQAMMEMYLSTLNSAQAQVECDDYLKDEAGSQTWVHAGRHLRWY